MASQGRDVEIDILARDKTGPGVTSAERNFSRLNESVKKSTRRMVDEGGKAGVQVGLAFGQNLRLTISRAAPAIAPILAGTAIAAAPLIGASISSAIIGGAGVGGVIGGVLLASRDARVQAAGKALGASIMGQLEQRAGVFVGPVLDSIRQIQASFGRADADIAAILRKSATFVRPLTSGVTYAFERITSGVNRLVQAAGPVIDSLKEGVSEFGENVEAVMASLEDNGVDAASALAVSFDILNFSVRAVGESVNALTEAYGFLAKFGAFGKDAALNYHAMEVSAKAAAQANEQTGGSLDRVRRAAADAANEVRTYTSVLEEARNNNLTLTQAQARATIAVAETTARIKENNKEIGNAAQRNAHNTLALTDLAASFNAVREAQAKQMGVAVDSIPVTAQQRAAFIAAANQAGIYGQKAEDLANELLGIPKSVNPKVTLAAEEAKRDAAEFRRAVNAIPRAVRVVATFVQGAGVKVPGGTITKYDAMSSFVAADNSSGQTSRTGGPTPVNVYSNVHVDLDGKPFRDYTDRAINANEDRRRFRDRVGAR